jgi:hypothetical protein
LLRLFLSTASLRFLLAILITSGAGLPVFEGLPALKQSFAGVWRTNGELIQNEENWPNLRYRDYNDLIVPLARLAITERFPLTSFPKIWNSFNDFDIKFLRDKCEFNSKLKALLLSRLNANYRCNRLLCHFCHLSN